MAFQFSHEFHRNWLAASTTERNRIKQDLTAIVDLLKPDTELTAWQKKHGMYEKNTASAQQVGLFDEPTEPPPAPAAKLDAPTSSAQAIASQMTSSFLKSVTQGLQASSVDSDDDVHLSVGNPQHETDTQALADTITRQVEAYLDDALHAIKAEAAKRIQHEVARHFSQVSTPTNKS